MEENDEKAAANIQCIAAMGGLYHNSEEARELISGVLY